MSWYQCLPSSTTTVSIQVIETLAEAGLSYVARRVRVTVAVFVDGNAPRIGRRGQKDGGKQGDLHGD